MGNPKREVHAAQELDVSGWLTPRDLQHELRIGEKLCYRLLKAGDIPSVRIGNLYRVRREAVENLKNQASHRIGA